MAFFPRRKAALRFVASVVIPSAFVVLTTFMPVPARAAGDREVKSRVAPVYPELAKRMKITGAVRVEAKVNPDGNVLEAKAISGNRMLSPAAEDAVRKWKFESGAGVSTEQIEINFQ
jgi:TonB family protein